MNIRCLQKFFTTKNARLIYETVGKDVPPPRAVKPNEQLDRFHDEAKDMRDDPAKREELYQKSKTALEIAQKDKTPKVKQAAENLRVLLARAEKAEEDLKKGATHEAEVGIEAAHVHEVFMKLKGLLQSSPKEGTVEEPATGAEVASGGEKQPGGVDARGGTTAQSRDEAFTRTAPHLVGKGVSVATSEKGQQTVAAAPKEAEPVVVQFGKIPEGRDAFVTKYFGSLDNKENRRLLMTTFKVVIPELLKTSGPMQGAARQLEAIVTNWDHAKDPEKPKYALQAATAYHNILFGQTDNLMVPRKEPKTEPVFNPDSVQTPVEKVKAEPQLSAQTGGDITRDTSEFAAAATPQHKPRMAEMEYAYRASLEPPMGTSGSAVVTAEVKSPVAAASVEVPAAPAAIPVVEAVAAKAPQVAPAPVPAVAPVVTSSPAAAPKSAPTAAQASVKPESVASVAALPKTSKEFIESDRFPKGFSTPEARVKSYDSALTIIANEVKGDAKLMTAATVLKERITDAKKSVGEAEAEELAKGYMRSLYSLLKGEIPASLKDVAPVKADGPSITDTVLGTTSALKFTEAVQVASPAPVPKAAPVVKVGTAAAALTATGSGGGSDGALGKGTIDAIQAAGSVKPDVSQKTEVAKEAGPKIPKSLTDNIQSALAQFKEVKTGQMLTFLDANAPKDVQGNKDKQAKWEWHAWKRVNSDNTVSNLFKDTEGTIWDVTLDGEGKNIINMEPDKLSPAPPYVFSEAKEYLATGSKGIEAKGKQKKMPDFVDSKGFHWVVFQALKDLKDPYDYESFNISRKK